MTLLRCNVCKHQFGWKIIYRSLWFSFRTIQCSECGTKHDVASRSRHISMLLLIPMLLLGWVLNNFISFNPVSMVVGLVLILLFGVVISLFLPYLVKYSSDI
ncbi:TIGR04104 family putative zinc finger protein [Gracilibacillus boraciitolerans]